VSALSPAEVAKLQAKGAHRQPETAILRVCAGYLRAAGWFVIRIQQGLGAHKGISDLICVRKGRVVFAEVKTAKGRLSDWQDGFRQTIANEGGEYVVLRCLEDAIAMSGEKLR
jgi:hypothetical protein